MNDTCWCCPECLSLTNGHSSSDVADKYIKDPAFIDLEQYYDIDSPDHPLHHIAKAMSYHPTFLRTFLEAYTYILRETGPLPVDQRIYIGIMAASRHQSNYLLNFLCHQFLEVNGNKEWLYGLEYAMEKLQNLDELNRILAHRPWLLKRSHVFKLARKARQLWSASELTQATVLLVFYHTLVSLMSSCGVGIEDKPATSKCPHNLKDTITLHEPHELFDIDVLLKRMKLVEEELSSDDVTPEEKRARFNFVERQSVELLTRSKSKKKTDSESRFVFTKEMDFNYEDFAIQMEKNTNLMPLTFDQNSWEIDGYGVAYTYYCDSAELIDRMFKVAKSLTYHTVAERSNVDTSTFRTAIWNYTQCMLGVMHENYNYKVINALLEKNLRSYIKVVTCYPETVNRSLYDDFMKDLHPSEKVHINIMIAMARFQAELLYGFQAVREFMHKDC